MPRPEPALASASARAQGEVWPQRPLRLVIPNAPGSSVDTIGRILAHALAPLAGQAVVPDNKAGASGQIGMPQVARAAPDGYTLLITTNTTHAANEHLYKKLSYDPVKDFAPITGLGKGGQVLVVNPASPHKSVGDLVAFAKKNPGKLTFGSGSASSRVAGEMFKQLAGVDILHVPYKSNPFAITDLLAGQIDLMITDTSTGMPQITAGKLRALGYSTQKRSAQLPEVPTIDEAGVKGYDMGYWFAACAPAGTPAVVVNRLNELMQAATKSATAKSFFDMSGSEAWTTTPADLAKFQAAETLKWGKVIKAAGIEAE